MDTPIYCFKIGYLIWSSSLSALLSGCFSCTQNLHVCKCNAKLLITSNSSVSVVIPCQINNEYCTLYCLSPNCIFHAALPNFSIEALFKQMEENLKDDDLCVDDNYEEISEEDLARLELELRLAYALKAGYLGKFAFILIYVLVKNNIKNLAAEICLDRVVVLELFHYPPPNFLLMSSALSDKVVPATSVPETNPMDPSEGTRIDAAEPEPKAKLPVPYHAKQMVYAYEAEESAN
uniref:Uncharacterized protein n=1 Tax=Nelumbo nucifera TaxID=4432 RepID=A0A822Y3E1_NELNU|nr:TPA_asm: hypothetical protein HUJ06_028578 [Nelumbo nucifera]